MRKRREAFTIPLLIGREVWTPPARDPPPGGEGAGGQHGGRRKAAPEGPVLGLLNVAGANSAPFPGLRRPEPIPLVRATGGGETPVPIPNTAVKAPRGDDSAFKSA